MIMDEERLPDWIKKAIIDRFDATEMVELLDLSINEIVEVFEGEILDRLEEIEEYMQIQEEIEVWDRLS